MRIPHGEWVGTRPALGTCFPHFPPATLRDRRDAAFRSRRRASSLLGSAWEFPSFENAETFAAVFLWGGLALRNPRVIGGR